MISRNYIYGSAWGDFYTHIKEYYKWRYSSEGLWREYMKGCTKMAEINSTMTVEEIYNELLKGVK